MAPCASCIFPGYPDSYGPARQAFAVVVIAFTIFSILGGFALAYLRRKHRLIASRDWTNTLLFAFGLLLSLEVPFREYFGEGAMPCPAYFFVVYFASGLLPATLAARFVGLYTRHVMQRQAVRLAKPSSLASIINSGDGIELTGAESLHTESSPDASLTAADSEVGALGTWRVPAWVRSFYAALDGALVSHRLDTSCGQLKLVATTLIPWVIYYSIRMGLAPPYRSADAVGCRVDTLDISLMVCLGMAYVGLVTPLFLPLLHTPDNLLLRTDLGLNTLTSSPLLLWMFLFKFEWTLDVNILNGGYAITFETLLVLWTSVWVPALVSLRSAEQDAPAGLRHALDVDNAGRTNSTATVVALDAFPHGHKTEVVDDDVAGGHGHGVAISVPLRATSSRRLSASAFTGVDTPHHATRARRGSGSVLSPRGIATNLAAFRLIMPIPTLAEVTKTLLLPHGVVLSSARALRIISALLISTPSGQAILRDVLAVELCGELLTFLIRASELRRALAKLYRRVVTSTRRLAGPTAAGVVRDAGAGVTSPSTLQAPPTTLCRGVGGVSRRSSASVHPWPIAELPVRSSSTGAAMSHEQQQQQQSTQTGALFQPGVACIADEEDSEEDDGEVDALTPARPSATATVAGVSAAVSATDASATAATSAGLAAAAAAAAACDALDEAASRVEALVALFVTPGARFEVNLSARSCHRIADASAALLSAATSMRQAQGAEAAAAAAAAGAGAIGCMRSELQAAEHDIFIVITCGPVFRLVGGGGGSSAATLLRAYEAWVTGALDALAQQQTQQSAAPPP